MINTRAKLTVRAALLTELSRSLDSGRPPCWGSGERISKCRVLRELGIELCSLSALERRGHTLKLRQTPAVYGYFDAPIQASVGLYWLGVQTHPPALDPLETK